MRRFSSSVCQLNFLESVGKIVTLFPIIALVEFLLVCGLSFGTHLDTGIVIHQPVTEPTLGFFINCTIDEITTVEMVGVVIGVGSPQRVAST